MGHGRVQECGDDTTVDEILIPLKLLTGDESRPYAASLIRFENKGPGTGMQRSAEQASVMAVACLLALS